MNKVLNPELLGVSKYSADMRPGEVCLANAAAFESIFFSQPLTAYAVGWSILTQKLEDELSTLCPAIETPERFEYMVADNATAFLGENDDSDIREIDAGFKTVMARNNMVQARTYEKGLVKRLDARDIEANPNARTQAVDHLKTRLLRAEIWRAAVLLSGAATIQNRNWATGTTADVDPDTDLLQILDACETASGVMPNRGVFGAGAWIKRQKGLRASLTPGGFASSSLNEQQLADFLGLDSVARSRAMRTMNDTAKQRIIGQNRVFLFNAQDGASRDDPSNIKRFVSNMFGGRWFVFEQQVSARVWDITVAHASNIAITSPLGIAVLDVA